MCGISGIYNFGNSRPVCSSTIDQMDAVQEYRGPDERGRHIEDRIGLGNRRLAIIDRAHGQQPMSNDDKSVWITYNGEVYNYPELRADLEGRGYRFRSGSDTEVVLRSYEAYGEGCVDRFNGQFAFAIWDSRAPRLFLARDRLGIAPLHYAERDGQFIFASEAKALFRHPDVKPQIDHEAVVEALLCGTLFAGRTMFGGIRSLEPGYTMTVTPSGVARRQYWDIPLTAEGNGHDTEATYREKLIPLLEDALKIRLVGEVPWGMMLSGGTDSSTLTSLATRMTPDPIQTFTIDFPNPWKLKTTDAHYARLMAEELRTKHREFMINPDDYYATLEQVVYHLERPFNKGASTMYLLYKHLKDHATVVITGEGADELFAGYVGERGLGLDEIVSSGAITELPWAAYWKVTSLLFNDDFARKVRPEEIFHQRLSDALAQMDGGDPLNRGLYLYTKYFLLELLELHDRTSLAFGVEARLPFLDHRFVELTCPMPSSMKVKNGRTKHIFKDAVSHLLPSMIIDRKKTPMPIPRDPETLLRQTRLTREMICDPNSRTAAYYDLRRVNDFLDRRAEFEGIDALSIWKVSMYLITLELLHRIYSL